MKNNMDYDIIEDMVDQPTNIPEADILYHWQVLDKKIHQRSIVWYAVAGLVCAGLLAFAAFSANFLFAIMILLFIFIIIIKQSKPGQNLPVLILYDGLWIGSDFYPWKDFKSFYILYVPNEVHKVYFEFKSIKPDMYVEFGDENPMEIREALLQVLKEDLEKDEESFSDVLQRLLKI